MTDWHGSEQLEDPGRRACLGRLLVAGSAALMPWARVLAGVPERSLAFYNTHTGEQLRAVYYSHGEYLDDALADIDHLLRDHRTDEVHAIEPALLDLLAAVQRGIEHHGTFEVISGYRSPKTNAMLAARSGGVAKRSLHMQGRAIDVRLPGVRTRWLRRAAMALERGGVGYYARSDFVHLDTGRVRSW